MADKNIDAARKTYGSFVGMVKVATPIIIAIVFIVIWLLAS